MSGETKQRISDLEAEVAFYRKANDVLTDANRSMQIAYDRMLIETGEMTKALGSDRLTPRDYFAASILNGIAVSAPPSFFKTLPKDSSALDDISELCFRMADAILKARNAKDEG